MQTSPVERQRLSTPISSLRAQRSNPVCLRGEILDCFAALAMTGCGQPHRSPTHIPNSLHPRAYFAATTVNATRARRDQ
ncbi:hypothetical protein FXV83_10405 [Bradyrhizobium hipponense]|uniref:Uncharacterized protein n=1 Tax=Bradyrhizobium hipponense TaxID=2605638 RepID=A0A5S4YTJ9_9BRAD|nr:hypothetical protein FXV83_10405 [Bradyrhizobium hipponense]